MSVFCFTTGVLCRKTFANTEPRLGQKLQHGESQARDIGLYIPEFSKPTGRYVSRLFLRVFNALLRRGSLVFAGNPCTSGMSVFYHDREAEIISALQLKEIQIVVCNFWDTPYTQQGIVFRAEPFMLLKIRPEWKNIEDYKQAMHSKYRVRVNKALSCSRHLTSEWLRGSELDEENISVMANLLAATLAQKTLALPSDLRGLIKGFCKEFGNAYQTVFCRDGSGKVVGFLSAVITGKKVFAMHIGYLPEDARAWHLYQRLMIDLIEKFTGSGITDIQLGRTATEIKSTLGAEPQQNSITIYTKSIVLKYVLKIYKRYFFNPKDYILRRPFREN